MVRNDSFQEGAMRMPCWRFTVTRMMIAVATSAILLDIARERQDRFRKLAGTYAAQAQALGLDVRIPVNGKKS
jgi:hypothetical protein